MKESQEQFVIRELKLNGFISRNYCLSLYNLNVRPNITRLGAIIHNLNEDGWVIEGKWEKRDGIKDFVYRVANMPFKKVIYRIVVDAEKGQFKEIVKYEKIKTI